MGHEWAYEKDFCMLGTFGLEPNPSLINEQHLHSSSPKYHNQAMLPVGADAPNMKRSPGSPCISLGGPRQNMPFRWHQDVQTKVREAELGPFSKIYSPGQCSLVSQGCTFSSIKLRTNRRKKMLALNKPSKGLSLMRAPIKDISTPQSLRTGSSFG